MVNRRLLKEFESEHCFPEEVTWDSFGPDPQTLTCPVCKNRVITITHSSCSWKTHLASTLMCFLCCPFCLVPYFVNVFKTVQHFCPACGLMLGEYRA
ncbi:unnamed protein product [Nezara viridula]|uniref:LITAF domain-containing protein n=1 Tax=Nezara viridula TaxID=85310 RepID=A0A9P0HBA0_NEZVI|nr:unnamed protein product [Nezara viridula]